MDEILRYILTTIFFLISITLIVLVVSQSHRSEGLGAMGGGASSGPVRGRAGVEEQLATYTKWVAAAFMILAAVLYFLGERFGWG